MIYDDDSVLSSYVDDFREMSLCIDIDRLLSVSLNHMKTRIFMGRHKSAEQRFYIWDFWEHGY